MCLCPLKELAGGKFHWFRTVRTRSLYRAFIVSNHSINRVFIYNFTLLDKSKGVCFLRSLTIPTCNILFVTGYLNELFDS